MITTSSQICCSVQGKLQARAILLKSATCYWNNADDNNCQFEQQSCGTQNQNYELKDDKTLVELRGTVVLFVDSQWVSITISNLFDGNYSNLIQN